MDWQQVISDPTLADLPYKIELNEWGNIEMSPASNRHSGLQMAIALLLRVHLPNGKSYTEMSINTSKNVKVADVVWGSTRFFEKHGLETPYTRAPEICVEVISPSNSNAEMMIKKDLYLAKGAQEVWFCSEAGEMSFYDHGGQLETSALCSDFPKVVEP
ncbi:MAG: Uma2 family endonuclease [Deinococcota bacterium]